MSAGAVVSCALSAVAVKDARSRTWSLLLGLELELLMVWILLIVPRSRPWHLRMLSCVDPDMRGILDPVGFHEWSTMRAKGTSFRHRTKLEVNRELS